MRRHRTDAVSLGFGLLFLAIAGWWVLSRYLDLGIDVPHTGWVAAALLIVLGLLGVAASLRRNPAQPGDLSHNAASTDQISATHVSVAHTGAAHVSMAQPTDSPTSDDAPSLDDTPSRPEPTY
jgi:hypothetical protein